jgi:tyrosinase
VLYATVQRIAGQFPQTLRARYVEAAKGFRMPYWDWATKTTGQTTTFPTIFTSPTVPVVGIDGTTKQINNPLFSFRFDDKTIPKNLALSRSVSCCYSVESARLIMTVDAVSHHRSQP